MFRIRTPRAGLLGAAASVALAALSLTACSDQGSGSRDEGAATAAVADQLSALGSSATSAHASGAGNAPTAAPSKAPASAGRRPAAAPPAAHAGSRPAPAHAAPTAPSAATSKPVTCTASNTEITASLVKRPVNHMLLTVTNTGSKTCYLYQYPQLQFTGAQAVPPVIDDSIPQAVTTLDPGESGYASVTLSAGDGSGTNPRTAKTLNVYFQGRSGNSLDGAAHVALPAGGVHIDDSLKTTYWEQTMQDALAW